MSGTKLNILFRSAGINQLKMCNFAAEFEFRVLGKPLKKQEDGHKQKDCERAVHAFQHALLRLPYYGKRA